MRRFITYHVYFLLIYPLPFNTIVSTVAMTETSLHKSIKSRYSPEKESQEIFISGFYVDAIESGTLIEIQTQHFYQIRTKLTALVDYYPIRLVLPIPREKWIVYLDQNSEERISRRKSPRRGRWEDIFYELVHIPNLLTHPNFVLEALLIQQEDVYRRDGKGSWRRKGNSIVDRRLVSVLESRIFSTPEDFTSFLPADLPDQFTNRDIARLQSVPRNLASKMSYSLRNLNLIQPTGKSGRSILYQRSKN